MVHPPTAQPTISPQHHKIEKIINIRDQGPHLSNPGRPWNLISTLKKNPSFGVLTVDGGSGRLAGEPSSVQDLVPKA
jgi:hypothetical protein